MGRKIGEWRSGHPRFTASARRNTSDLPHQFFSSDQWHSWEDRRRENSPPKLFGAAGWSFPMADSALTGGGALASCAITRLTSLAGCQAPWQLRPEDAIWLYSAHPLFCCLAAYIAPSAFLSSSCSDCPSSG